MTNFRTYRFALQIERKNPGSPLIWIDIVLQTEYITGSAW